MSQPAMQAMTPTHPQNEVRMVAIATITMIAKPTIMM